MDRKLKPSLLEEEKGDLVSGEDAQQGFKDT
ncbi:MAG: hypothetical protein CM1200mP30_01310 [Pseudomonadota bacterium]|nr:MAG: hypothetical protein CM1200mP30_01310 [Pseudomonadota bacterium]